MHKVKIIAIAITAIAALSAIASSMAGAAFPRYLPSNGGTFPVEFTGFSGGGTLAIKGGNTIECEKNRERGVILNDTNLTVTSDFEKCKIFNLVSAHSLGDAGETILVTSTGLLCELKANEAGVILTPTGKVHIEGLGQLALVEGSVIGVLTPSLTLTLEFRLLLKQRAAGEQEQLRCGGIETHLTASENEKASAAASEVTHVVIGILGTTGELMT